MDGSSRDMNYGGWSHKLEFFAFSTETPGCERFTIGQSWDPHRVLVEYGLPEGWSLLSHFYAFSTKQPGTTQFSVMEAFNPHRAMICRDASGCSPQWMHKFNFFAYPDQKSHVAAIGQARSILWGLPHLSGLLQRAFWSWAIFARDARVLEQTDVRMGVLHDLELEIEDQMHKVQQMNVQVQTHSSILAEDNTNLQQATERAEGALYSTYHTTSTAQGFSREVQQMRRDNEARKISMALLKAKVDSTLTSQCIEAQQRDKIHQEVLQQGLRQVEEKEIDFVKREKSLRKPVATSVLAS